MIEILYLTHNRVEFTRASLEALRQNTDWTLAERMVIYDDRSSDGTLEFLQQVKHKFPVTVHVKPVALGSPVACMNDYICSHQPELFAKIDNDTMVPPGWLNDCMAVMDVSPELDLLGIEAMYRPLSGVERRVEPCEYIGGIGLMRGRAFQYGLPRPDGRFGFTSFQSSRADLRKGWLNPSLQVFLLDRLPMQPWHSLSQAYVAKGWQRPWQPYTAEDAALWQWWTQ